jgi:hypothetical protein
MGLHDRVHDEAHTGTCYEPVLHPLWVSCSMILTVTTNRPAHPDSHDVIANV